jgi:putative flippase GtrA
MKVSVRSVALIARHQTGALVATGLDFLAMIAWVELGVGGPVSGAGAGAATGAISNFILGRQWIFRVSGSPWGQALRYVLVSVGSLGLNSAGQLLLLRTSHLPYVVSRVLVAAVVGLGWNFPLHRRFVFPRRSRAP